MSLHFEQTSNFHLYTFSNQLDLLNYYLFSFLLSPFSRTALVLFIIFAIAIRINDQTLTAFASLSKSWLMEILSFLRKKAYPIEASRQMTTGISNANVKLLRE